MANTFQIVLRKEAKELWRDGRFRWSTILLVVLLSAALTDGWQRYDEAQHSATQLQQAERERWLNQGNKNPHSAAHQGLLVFRPQLPIAALDPGIDPYVGRAVRLEAHSQRLFGLRPAEDSDPVRRLGELTAAVTLQQIAPLLIIVLAFNAFAGEREAGTLAQLLSAGVPARRIGWAKAVGATLPLILWLVPVTALALLVLWLGSNAHLTAPVLPRFLLALLAYLLYFAAFLAITLAVSARAANSRQALVVLLVFWLAACLLLPPAITDLAQRAHPSLSALDLAAALREGKMRLPVWYEQLGSVEKQLLKEYDVENVNDLPISANGVAMVAEEDDFNQVQEEHYGELYRAHRRQNNFYEAAGFLSPLVALQPLSMGLAGTDLEQHLDFALAAEAYRREMTQIMNRDLAENELEAKKTAVRFPSVIEKMYQPGRKLWRKVSPFQYEFFDLGRVLQNHGLSMIYLVGWALGSFWLAARAISRLQVT